MTKWKNPQNEMKKLEMASMRASGLKKVCDEIGATLEQVRDFCYRVTKDGVSIYYWANSGTAQYNKTEVYHEQQPVHIGSLVLSLVERQKAA